MQAALIASTAISAYSQIQAGKYQKAAYEAEAQQYEQEAKMASLQAKEESLAREKEYQSARSRNILLASAAGYDPYESGSFLALEKEEEKTRDFDVSGISLMGRAQAQKQRTAAWSSRISAKSAMTSAYGGAAGTLFSGYSKYKEIS
jgi:hypothetical protein